MIPRPFQVFYKKYGDDRAPPPGTSVGDGGGGAGASAVEPLIDVPSGQGDGASDASGGGWSAMMDVELSLLVIGVIGVFSVVLIPLAFPALQVCADALTQRSVHARSPSAGMQARRGARGFCA